VEVLHGISSHIRKGERVALVGESGSGKSVTARIVLGLLQELPARGCRGWSVRGRDLEKFGARRARAHCAAPRMSMIFQDPTSSLNPGLHDRGSSTRC
jgi:ABC-type dipeptide/oligopeptide/nickel transport system ATPase component